MGCTTPAWGASVGPPELQLKGPPSEAHQYVVSADNGAWVFRDDGLAPLAAGAPCVALDGQNAAECPPAPGDGQQAARIILGEGDSLRTVGRLPGHLLVEAEGAAAHVDVRDGVMDEVRCWGPDASVDADPVDVVRAQCTTRNGVSWQQDTVVAHATEFDALDGFVAWVDAEGRLGLRAHGHSVMRRPLGAARPVSGLSLGLDEQGAVIAVFSGCITVGGCGDWYSLRVRDGVLRRLHPRGRPRCEVDSVAAWRGTLTVGQSCASSKRVLVTSETRRRTVVLLRHIGDFTDEFRQPTLVSNRGRVVAVKDSSWSSDNFPGSLWLVRSGPDGCRARIDEAEGEGDYGYLPDRPLLTRGAIAWASDLFGIGIEELFEVKIARLRAGCRLGPTRYAALPGLSTAALPIGRGLFYIAKQCRFCPGTTARLRVRHLVTKPRDGAPSVDWSFAYPPSTGG